MMMLRSMGIAIPMMLSVALRMAYMDTRNRDVPVPLLPLRTPHTPNAMAMDASIRRTTCISGPPDWLTVPKL